MQKNVKIWEETQNVYQDIIQLYGYNQVKSIDSQRSAACAARKEAQASLKAAEQPWKETLAKYWKTREAFDPTLSLPSRV